ncbi:hypothetical protein [Poseidonocella sp. HB161398]|uniref:hypothetical protein n=1 Tax=Poseidonocella sp. HB161398 TaxID=2320855 RepID=UPI001109FF3B|nr:hypothetical protein [Poseidonocella sp. HB161398]
MPRHRRSSDPSIIERDILDALARLEAGKPRHPDLADRLRRGKPVKVNIANVAKEAGRSRTLIGMENCAFPALRNRVLAAAGQEGVEPGNLNDVIKRLRAENAELKAERDDARKHAAWHLLERQKAEKELLRCKAHLERLRTKRDAAGTVVALRPEE